MGTKISELVSGNPAAVLTGAEGVEMTQSGNSVGALVSQLRDYVDSSIAERTGVEFTVPTLSSLKALTTRPAVVTVKTGQAAGQWQWEAGSSTTANDGTVVECTSGDAGRYKRIYDGAPYVEWFGATGDGVTDDSAAFVAALLVSTVINCTPFRTYLIKDVTVSGRTVQLNNAVIKPYTGAKYCFRLTGFAPQILGPGSIIDPDGVVAKQTTLSVGESATDTNIVVSDATGFEIGQWFAVMQDDGYPHGSLITNVVGTTITIQRGLRANAASGSVVCASWGMVNINNCSRYLIEDVNFINTSIGIWNDRGSTAGATNTKGSLTNVIIQDVTFCGIGWGRDVGEESRSNVRIRGGRARTQTATGNGVTTQYDTDRPMWLKADLSVTLDGVSTSAYTFVDTNTFQFNVAPGNGVAISYTNLYDGWFGNFIDESGWSLIQGGGQWVNCEHLNFFYGTYLADFQLYNFTNVIDDGNQTNLYIWDCDQLYYGLYFNGFASRTIAVGGNSLKIQFGGPLQTTLMPTANTVSGSVLGNVFVDTGSEITINTLEWTLQSDKTVSGSGTFTTASTLSSTATVPAFLATNNADNASVTVATFEGDRETPADFDGAGIALRLSDTSGTQREFARLGWIAQDADVATGLDGAVLISTMVASVLTGILRIESLGVRPATNDGVALGSALLSFADLFLASGGVINWNNGAYTLTQATTALTGSGSLAATTFIKSGSTTVGALPAAATAGVGARYMVTDSNATLTAGIGAVVAAGGANVVPVVSDGTNWRIG